MRLARGGGSVMALNVAGMAQALLLQVVLARLLGHEGYGQFAYVMAWINILVYVAVMGHDSLVMRSVAAYHARQEWALLAGTLRHAEYHEAQTHQECGSNASDSPYHVNNLLLFHLGFR